MTWKPIETAPINEPVLLWGKGYEKPKSGVRASNIEPELVYIEGGQGYATHWMELPEPPEAA